MTTAGNAVCGTDVARIHAGNAGIAPPIAADAACSLDIASFAVRGAVCSRFRHTRILVGVCARGCLCNAFAVAVADFVVGAVAFLSFRAVDAHAANTCLHQHFTGFAR